MTLTPELKEAVEKAGDEPVRVEDPETHTACSTAARGPRCLTRPANSRDRPTASCESVIHPAPGAVRRSCPFL